MFVKAGSAITNGTPNSNPATYTGNAVFGSGTPYFNDAAAYCVYKGDAASINVSGLTGNTTYHVTVLKVVENVNSDGTYSYSTALTGSFTTPTIAAPVATAATSLGSSSFVANWNAVLGATGYVIDVSTTPFELLDIVGWNFPNNPDNNVADLGITENSLKTLTTQGTNNPSYQPITLTPPLQSSITSVATVEGNWNSEINPKFWQIEFSTLGYNQLKLFSVQRSSPTGPRDFKAQYKVGEDGTWTDIPGATTITLANDWSTGVLNNISLPSDCNNQPSVFVRWILMSNIAVNGLSVAGGGTSAIDDVYIRSEYNLNYVQPYQDYPVGNVTSFEVTGLDPNTTYYYIVRAIDGSTETANSNQIQVQTTQDIAVADFRSRITGDYDTAATWEYDSGVTALGWVIATVPPSGNNNVLIQAPHTVTMTDEVTFNSGKTLTVNGKLLTSTYTITGAGGITVPSGGVVASALSITDTDTFSSSLAVSGTIDFQTGSTFELNGTAKQYLDERTFSNLKISNTSGVKALGDLTVDGELSLAVNPNDTDGALDMVIDYGTYATNPYGTGDYANSTLAFNNLNSHILTMGPTATTAGPGDVTGKIRRTTIADNTTYTFGNVNTQLRFNSVSNSVLPTQITVVATRGNHGTHIDNTGGVLINGYTANRNTLKRMYQVLRLGGDNTTRFTLRMAYQDSELNGNSVEDKLVTWDHHIPYGGRTPHEHGKTNFDPTNNWVELSNHSVAYLATEGDFAFTKYWMLSTKETVSDYVWLGAVGTLINGTNWNILSNWSGGKIPSSISDVLIPSASTTNNDPIINTSSGYGIGDYTTFTAGEVRMRTLEIASGGILNVESESASKITLYGGPNANGGGINYGSWDNKGTFNPGNSKVIFDYDATASESTISGTTQFYDVEIATGKKATVQSDTQISISNTLVNNGTFNAALLPNTITYNGTTAQTVLPTTYYNLTIANGVSATLGGNATTLNTLTLSDKFLTTGSYKMTMGISGVVSRTTGFVKGTLEKPLASTPSLFEIGTTVYAPVTVASTGLSGSVLVAAKATTGTPSQGSVLNASAKSDTYWTLTKSGAGSITNYTASFDIANTTNTGTLSRYRIAHYPASSWNILPTPTIAGTLYTTPTRTAFGDFELGEVKKTIWRQTGWDPFAPDVYTDAEIDWPYTTASNGGGFSSNSLVINSGQSLEITDGFSVTVANEIINNSSASSVTVENNANLIQLNDGINTGAITAKRNSAPMIRLDYTFWSSPVLGQNVYAFSPLTLVNRIYLFSTPINYYTTNGLSSLTTFAPGVAYVIRAPNNYSSSTPTVYNGIFTGVPNNGNYTFTLNTSSLGYNGVGNPYPSTIDATSFVNDNSSVIDGTLYFFAHTGTGEEAGQFALWNLSGGTAAASAPNSPGTAVAPNGTIQVGQGFIVKSLSTGDSLVFKNTQRIHDTRNQFYRSNSIPSVSNASVIERHRMWLNLSKIESSGAARMMNQMMVAYVSGATNDVDRGFDGLSYTSSGTLLASRLNGKNYSIQGRALPFTSTDVVPLVFKTTTVGTFEINLSNVDGLFTSASQPVYLYDKTLGRYHNLKTTPYRFTSEEGTFDLRFELVYPNMTLGINDSGLTTSVVYVSNDVLHIESLTEAIEEVRIFDLAGRLLLDKYQLNTLAFSADKLPFRDVVLLVQFKTVSGAVVTRKVKF